MEAKENYTERQMVTMGSTDQKRKGVSPCRLRKIRWLDAVTRFDMYLFDEDGIRVGCSRRLFLASALSYVGVAVVPEFALAKPILAGVSGHRPTFKQRGPGIKVYLPDGYSYPALNKSFFGSKRTLAGKVRRHWKDGRVYRHGGDDWKARRGTPVYSGVTGEVIHVVSSGKRGVAGASNVIYTKFGEPDFNGNFPILVDKHVGRIRVKPGDKVEAGLTQTCSVDDTGARVGPHLHQHIERGLRVAERRVRGRTESFVTNVHGDRSKTFSIMNYAIDTDPKNATRVTMAVVTADTDMSYVEAGKYGVIYPFHATRT